MCTSPIHLSNKGNLVNNRLSSDGVISQEITYAYDVPCGHCESCKQQKRDSYLLRCMSEFSRCQHKGVFLTLTYSNKFLPKLRFKSTPIFDDDGYCVRESKTYTRSVWNKTHVQKFLKTINEKLYYLIGTKYLNLTRLITVDGHRRISDEWKHFISVTPRPIKYLCVCERGKANIYYDDKGNQRKGSARPHYHVILFITHPALSVDDVLKLCSEEWTYGLSYNIQIGTGNQSIDRDLMKSFKYVTKYVTKDLNDESNKLWYLSHEEGLIYKPFTLVSNGLGDNLLDNYQTDNELLNHILNGVTVHDGDIDRNIPVPRYNLLKSKMYVRHHVGTFVTSRVPVYESICPDRSNQPIFIDHGTDLEYHIYNKYETYLTDFGQRVKYAQIDKKVSIYVDLLRTFQKNQSIYTDLCSLQYAKCKYDGINDIMSVNPSDFDSFLRNLYKLKDDSLLPDVNFRTYIHIKNYIQTKSIFDKKNRDVMYPTLLEKALLKNPHLFNQKPI